MKVEAQLALVQRMKQEFDLAFELPATPADTQAHTLWVRLRLGDESALVPLEQIAHYSLLPALTRLPRSRKGLLGLAVLRGKATVIFDLAQLLDRPPTTTATYVLLSRQDESVGFAVHQLEGVLKLAPQEGSWVQAESGELLELLSLEQAFERLPGYGVSSSSEPVSSARGGQTP